MTNTERDDEFLSVAQHLSRAAACAAGSVHANAGACAKVRRRLGTPGSAHRLVRTRPGVPAIPGRAATRRPRYGGEWARGARHRFGVRQDHGDAPVAIGEAADRRRRAGLHCPAPAHRGRPRDAASQVRAHAAMPAGTVPARGRERAGPRPPAETSPADGRHGQAARRQRCPKRTAGNHRAGRSPR